MSRYNSQEDTNVLTFDIDTEINSILEIDETKNETSSFKSYISRRAKKKLLTPFLVTISVIVLFLIIIMIMVISLIKINLLEKELEKLSDPEKISKKVDSNYPNQDLLDVSDNLKTNDEKKNTFVSQKYILDGNNGSENDVTFAKETTLPGIDYSEKIYEKSNTSFSQGTTFQSTNNTEKLPEKSIGHFSQDDILQVNDSVGKANSHLPQKMIIYGDKSIYFFYPNTKEYHLLYKDENTIGAFTAFNKGIIFVTETNISRIHYLPNESLNATQRNLSIIFEEPKVKPYAMEINFISENLYIIDKDMGALIILNITNKKYNLLLTDLKNPCDIVLDSIKSFIFIVQATDSILRSNMDGRKLMKIVENSSITAITVNEKEKRIYWVSDISNIESSDYDGNDRKLFLTDSFYISSLTLIKDQLFWLCPAKGLSNAILLFSKTDNGSSISIPNLETIYILQNPKSIKSVSYENQNISNSFHHPCQHIGIEIPSTTYFDYTCICQIGWQIIYGRSCQLVTDIDFMLYSKANFIRGCTLEFRRKSTIDIIWPTLYHIEFLNNKNSIHFSYDLKNDDFYFSDDCHLYKMKLKAPLSNQTILLAVDKQSSVIEDIIYDWLTGNLYYIVRSLSEETPHKLKIFNTKLGIKFQKTLKIFAYRKDLPFTGCPFAMIVNPNRNALFFNKFYHKFTNNLLGNVRYIERNNMNGTDVSRTIITDNITIFTKENKNTLGLVTAIDYTSDKIYRISESDLNTRISYTTFDGSNEKSFTVRSINYVKFMDIHEQWLYLSNGINIWRVDKESGNWNIKIIPSFENNMYQQITALKIISSSIQFTSENNSCVINNGNCEQFCFNLPEIICDCENDKYIQKDGHHCN